ncbi:nuclear transport factor 2 family protein [Serratia ureilytica]
MSPIKTLQDTIDIAALTNGWIYRDTARWEELRGLFHTDGIIEIGWFKGLFSEFIEASIRMQGAAEIQSKHIMANPLIKIKGDRAVAETSAVLVGVNNRLKLGFTGYTRFFDLIERRNGVWKIYKRNNIYDMCFFSFPAGPIVIDQSKLARYPWEYAPLAYVIEASGHEVTLTHPTRGSEEEAKLYETGTNWLKGCPYILSCIFK